MAGARTSVVLLLLEFFRQRELDEDEEEEEEAEEDTATEEATAGKQEAEEGVADGETLLEEQEQAAKQTTAEELNTSQAEATTMTTTTPADAAVDADTANIDEADKAAPVQDIESTAAAAIAETEQVAAPPEEAAKPPPADGKQELSARKVPPLQLALSNTSDPSASTSNPDACRPTLCSQSTPVCNIAGPKPKHVPPVVTPLPVRRRLRLRCLPSPHCST